MVKRMRRLKRVKTTCFFCTNPVVYASFVKRFALVCFRFELFSLTACAVLETAVRFQQTVCAGWQ
jgi:hypothetical protein